MTTVRDWFSSSTTQALASQDTLTLVALAAAIWPAIVVVRQDGTMPSTGQWFKMHKAIKKESGFVDYYPMMVGIGNRVYMFFENDQHRLVAIKHFEVIGGFIVDRL